MFRPLGGILLATTIACAKTPGVAHDSTGARDSTVATPSGATLSVPGGHAFRLAQGDSVVVVGGQAAVNSLSTSDSVVVVGGQAMCTITVSAILPDTTVQKYILRVHC